MHGYGHTGAASLGSRWRSTCSTLLSFASPPRPLREAILCSNHVAGSSQPMVLAANSKMALSNLSRCLSLVTTVGSLSHLRAG